ncbi:GNAT family N-acetyltransferase [Spirosoma montaniterrae]|uniref:N-acetyltransferase domain-containing protein n=1 Tax=Spirosoma montaniterrae TaxID=1178516 RepID=A0A1P9WRR0_9BACT|nr:GNAT family N-acetyltransferase [Spirosoma montaniterrae]AQG78030.1 hypothetical protein AWR27_00890 [Spirosoma montaniterrae]
MNVEIRKLMPDDVASFMELIHLFRDVLETDKVTSARPEHLQRLLARPDFLVFGAWSDKQVVGGLTAYVLTQYYSEKPVVYLYDIAVSEPFQRKGIATELLTKLTQYCRSLGVEEVFVQAYQEDTEAVSFYRATGGAAMSVIHFTYPLHEHI